MWLWNKNSVPELPAEAREALLKRLREAVLLRAQPVPNDEDAVDAAEHAWKQWRGVTLNTLEKHYPQSAIHHAKQFKKKCDQHFVVLIERVARSLARRIEVHRLRLDEGIKLLFQWLDELPQSNVPTDEGADEAAPVDLLDVGEMHAEESTKGADTDADARAEVLAPEASSSAAIAVGSLAGADTAPNAIGKRAAAEAVDAASSAPASAAGLAIPGGVTVTLEREAEQGGEDRNAAIGGVGTPGTAASGPPARNSLVGVEGSPSAAGATTAGSAAATRETSPQVVPEAGASPPSYLLDRAGGYLTAGKRENVRETVGLFAKRLWLTGEGRTRVTGTFHDPKRAEIIRWLQGKRKDSKPCPKLPRSNSHLSPQLGAALAFSKWALESPEKPSGESNSLVVLGILARAFAGAKVPFVSVADKDIDERLIALWALGSARSSGAIPPVWLDESWLDKELARCRWP